MSFEQATGLDSSDYLTARGFIGNEALGFKEALCERDIAIYLSILLFGIVYAIAGRKMPPLPVILWILVGLIPIGVDGLTQFLSQPPFSIFPFRESTPFLRALTGFLFGFSTAWFGYPMVESSMVETRRLLGLKLARVKGNLIPGV
jgi:uncharacterized membrane protein